MEGTEARSWVVTEGQQSPHGGRKWWVGAVASSSEPSRLPSLGISLERWPQPCGLHGLKQFLKLSTADVGAGAFSGVGLSCAQ